MLNSNKEINIDVNCSVSVSKNKLTVNTNLLPISNFYRTPLLVIISITIISVILLITINEMYSLMLVLSLSSFFYIPFFCLYLYYKIMKQTWIFDNSSKMIIFHRSFYSYKKIKTFYFSEIESLTYRRDLRFIFGNIHNLVFVLRNAKNIRIYKGGKDECKKLGIIISNFMSTFLE